MSPSFDGALPRLRRVAGRLGRALALLAVATSAGCGSCGEPAPPAPAPPGPTQAKAAPAGPRLEGNIIIGDVRQRVLPFIGRSADLDLFVQCRQQFEDKAKAGGGPVHLCYDATPRTNEYRVARIEHVEGQKGGRSMRALAAAYEGMHFLVERSGSLYQTLDLAYAARRDGKYRRDEIRIVSGNRAAHERLREALLGIFPGLRVEVVPFVAPEPAPGPPKIDVGGIAPPEVGDELPPPTNSPAEP